MTTVHHPAHSAVGTRGGLDIVAVLLVALPALAVVVTTLVALTGRWGGLHDSLVTVWFIAMTIAWVAAPGALLLLVAHRGEPIIRRLVVPAVLAPVGWLVSLLSAAASGLADAPTFDGRWLGVVASTLGVTLFVGASTALAVLGLRARTNGSDSRS